MPKSIISTLKSLKTKPSAANTPDTTTSASQVTSDAATNNDSSQSSTPGKWFSYQSKHGGITNITGTQPTGTSTSHYNSILPRKNICWFLTSLHSSTSWIWQNPERSDSINNRTWWPYRKIRYNIHTIWYCKSDRCYCINCGRRLVTDDWLDLQYPPKDACIHGRYGRCSTTRRRCQVRTESISPQLVALTKVQDPSPYSFICVQAYHRSRSYPT